MIGALLLAAAVTGADVVEIQAAIHRRIDAEGAACRLAYRPASLAFLAPIVMGEEVVQPLRLTDREGRVWVAYYAMQRQGDGGWSASGCRVVRPGRLISA